MKSFISYAVMAGAITFSSFAEEAVNISLINQHAGPETNLNIHAQEKIELNSVQFEGRTHLSAGTQISIKGNSRISSEAILKVNSSLGYLQQGFPPEGEIVGNSDGDFYVYFYAPSLQNLNDVKVLNSQGLEIKDLLLSGGLLRVGVEGLSDGSQVLQLFIDDVLTETKSFILDNQPPELVVLPESKIFETTVAITAEVTDLSNAKIYYTLDGSMPFVGGASTQIINTTPTTGVFNLITLNDSTRLNALVIDEAGNQSPLISRFYEKTNPNPIPQNLNLQQLSNGKINLTWDAVSGATEYRIYRHAGTIEKQLLESAVTAGFIPPQSLLVDSTSSTSFQTSSPYPFLQFGWTVTAVTSGESLAAPIGTVQAQNLTTRSLPNSVQHGLFYLQGEQNVIGEFSVPSRSQVPSLSQTLEAIYALDVQGGYNVGFLRSYSLNRLRGLQAQALYPKFMRMHALNLFQENIDQEKFELELLKNESPEGIGYGSYPNHINAPMETLLSGKQFNLTALGSSYQDSSNQWFSHVEGGIGNFYVSAAMSKGKYSDIVHGQEVLFSDIKGFAYSELHTNQWQGTDLSSMNNLKTSLLQTWTDLGGGVGHFQGSIVATAAAIKWLNLSGAQLSSAKNYLIQQQQNNGSWEQDCFVTALCIEALIK